MERQETHTPPLPTPTNEEIEAQQKLEEAQKKVGEARAKAQADREAKAKVEAERKAREETEAAQKAKEEAEAKAAAEKVAAARLTAEAMKNLSTNPHRLMPKPAPKKSDAKEDNKKTGCHCNIA
ncbi:MAG: hypothetical protein A3I77_05550 [Gammaproteobacteria bacterium RIFCSPLOWO2_02_FULL_42_14]|nr:MAG: hypothetical protein A2624_05600 [Gammaproteobacteria bacterium RIFCSPHIGHO2_01_FULL_42_8]OGT53663.1 MAG: hypothetical protein A3E54_00290 [Gammaproteobacteria bacterium RIFCSPHIGHO2_12_FULL_41_25]OGT62728.1 MAG: hypothetical protein A3I77_05550 [Gammaproteobacteria bacterium RIFCSPLOWO2_02_FULL_42_14]